MWKPLKGNPSFWLVKVGLLCFLRSFLLKNKIFFKKEYFKSQRTKNNGFHIRAQIPQHFWRSNFAQKRHAIHPWHNTHAESPSPSGTTRNRWVYNSSQSRVEHTRLYLQGGPIMDEPASNFLWGCGQHQYLLWICPANPRRESSTLYEGAAWNVQMTLPHQRSVTKWCSAYSHMPWSYMTVSMLELVFN